MLFFGLPEHSRAKMELSGQKITLDQTLLAMITDSVNFLAWAQTKDSQKGRNKPKSVLDILLNGNSNANEQFKVFKSGEDFEKAYQKLSNGG